MEAVVMRGGDFDVTHIISKWDVVKTTWWTAIYLGRQWRTEGVVWVVGGWTRLLCWCSVLLVAWGVLADEHDRTRKKFHDENKF
jgi:hypothetical protein